MWFHVFCKIDYHLYVKAKVTFYWCKLKKQMMCLTTLYPSCLQNIPLKAVVFSQEKKTKTKKLSTAFFCCVIYFYLGGSIRLFLNPHRERVKDYTRCIMTAVFKDGRRERSPQKQSGLFEKRRSPISLLWERNSVSQYHVITTTFHIIVVEDTIPHYSWRSVYSDNAPMNSNNLLLRKKKSCQFIIMLDENAVSECGTKPVCISGIYLLCFYWQVLWLKKIASVTVYYPVHTRGCENLE